MRLTWSRMLNLRSWQRKNARGFDSPKQWSNPPQEETYLGNVSCIASSLVMMNQKGLPSDDNGFNAKGLNEKIRISLLYGWADDADAPYFNNCFPQYDISCGRYSDTSFRYDLWLAIHHASFVDSLLNGEILDEQRTTWWNY